MQDIPHHFFSAIRFAKDAVELRTAANKKIADLNRKIGIRRERIAKIREEYSISGADLNALYAQAMQHTHGYQGTYTIQGSGAADSREIPAGVLTNLQTEEGAIRDENAAVERLTRIVRNMPDGMHNVSYEDLEFLGL